MWSCWHLLLSRLRKNLGRVPWWSPRRRLGGGEVLLLLPPPPPPPSRSPLDVLRVERRSDCAHSAASAAEVGPRRRLGVPAGACPGVKWGGPVDVSLTAGWLSTDWGVEGLAPGLGERSCSALVEFDKGHVTRGVKVQLQKVKKKKKNPSQVKSGVLKLYWSGDRSLSRTSGLLHVRQVHIL